MGNIFSIQCGDALLGRCWDCIAQQPVYICHIEDNLEALKTAKEELLALRNDVNRAAFNQVDTPDTVLTDRVGGWIKEVDILILQAIALIDRGEQERQNLCIAGCCSKNCISSYSIGKRLAKRLKQVLDLKVNGVALKVLVMKEPTKKLQSDLETLKTTREQLLVLKADVQQRIDFERGPEKRPLRLVELWLSMVETTIAEADELITEGPQQVTNLSQADFSNFTFVGKVADKLRNMITLKFQGVFSEVVEREPSDPDFIRKLQDDLRVLEIRKEELWALKEDVVERVRLEEGRQQKPLQQVQLWLLKAEETVKEAGELAEQAPDEMEKFRLRNFSNRMIRPNVDRVLNDAIVLIATGNFKQVVGRALPERYQKIIQEPTVGTGAMLEAAWNCLVHDGVGILGICGIGGVGKTTLLTEINNKFASTPNNFDVVIFVVVSKDFKLEKIQEDIWNHIGFCDKKWLAKSSDEKAKDISYGMQRKKFALLLDDVWRQFNLRDVGIPPPNALQNGSKLVITARSSAVCTDMGAKRMITVKPLIPKDAWDLFHEKVGDIDAHNLPLAQQVASECCGLPIALITIGCTMASRTTTEEWKHALAVLQRSSPNSQGMVDEIYQGMEVHVFKRLKFSYDCLPNKIIQSCFLYCSLFPEDFKILKNDLVHYWTCENFCSLDGGHMIVGSLIRQCLLEEEGKYVKMHDVIRDMALWIACECKEEEEEKYIVRAGSKLTEVPEIGDWEGATRVSLMGNSFNYFQAMPNTSGDVVTLFLSHNPNLQSISEAVFPCKDKLKVLNISETAIKELPLEISELGLLQYLNLSHTRIRYLPMEFKSLVELMYLNLDYTGLLEMIPTGLLSSFSKLQVLKMFLCGSKSYDYDNGNILSYSDSLIQELLCLKNLVELSITIKSDSSLQSFCKEPTLLNCTRAIVLQQLKSSYLLNISSLATAKHLNLLLMFGNLNVQELVAVDIRHLTNNQQIYSSLQEVVVSNYNGMRELTWVIFAVNLTVLRVTFNDYIEAIVSPEKLSELEAADGSSNFFPKLQVLELCGLPKLETIYWKALYFPCLRQIDVFDCPKLKMLPLNSKSTTGCKVVIKGEESWWNNLEWEDDAARDVFSSGFQKI